MAEQKRFTITVDTALYQRLLDATDRHKPRLPKRYVVELAISRLLDEVDGGQLELGLELNVAPKK